MRLLRNNIWILRTLESVHDREEVPARMLGPRFAEVTGAGVNLLFSCKVQNPVRKPLYSVQRASIM